MLRLFRVRAYKDIGLCNWRLGDLNSKQSEVKHLLSTSTRTHTATSTAPEKNEEI